MGLDPTKIPAREAMQAVYEDLPNPDGNFVHDFQTTGFDSRVWELYMFAAGRASGLSVSREHESPDFLFSRADAGVWVEATVARHGALPLPQIPEIGEPGHEEALRLSHDHYRPIRLGSALHSKLKKRYWELPHVRDRPFAIAIADFDDPSPVRHSSGALLRYLFGVEPAHAEGVDSEARWRAVEPHSYAGRAPIPSGFFSLPDTEHISAVLFSSGGTVPKFTRMGYDPGRHSNLTFLRVGVELRPDPEEPRPFAYVVGHDPHEETWQEGLEVIHNPRALRPVPTGFFGCAVEYELRAGAPLGRQNGFHPMRSLTLANLEVPVDEVRQMGAAIIGLQAEGNNDE